MHQQSLIRKQYLYTHLKNNLCIRTSVTGWLVGVRVCMYVRLCVRACACLQVVEVRVKPVPLVCHGLPNPDDTTSPDTLLAHTD